MNKLKQRLLHYMDYITDELIADGLGLTVCAVVFVALVVLYGTIWLTIR
jgi:hypothetical protein